MQIHNLDEGRHIHMEIEPEDKLLPCPFCGSSDLELANTHTAAYWVACLICGAEHQGGRAYGSNTDSNRLTMRQHRMAKASALAAWNRRAPRGDSQ